MDTADNKTFEYIRKTALSDDFRRLIPDTETSATHAQPKPTCDVNCTICLETLDEPRTLPCQHKFCRVCLQYAINNSPPDPDSDRGFECIQCGHFVKVLNYSIPRSQWADNIPDTKLLYTGKERPSETTDTGPANTKHQDVQNRDNSRWALEWKVSTYPRSHFVQHGIDPHKRTKQGFVLNTGTANNGDNSTWHTPEGGSGAGLDSVGNKTGYDVNTVGGGKSSSITAAVYYGDILVIYDEGMCEVQLYNPDLTLKSSFRQTNIFSIAVLDSELFMTNPDDRCVVIVDLDNMGKKESIAITLKCFGISSFVDRLAVLLSDNSDKEFHISFLNSKGILNGRISLMNTEVATQFVFPRWLAVCPLTRLAYVSDERIGMVRCYRLDGHLNWERKAYGAGYLSVYNGYVIVARQFTSSLDVLSGGGTFAGRLESSVYGIEAPRVVAVRADEPRITVVDKHNMIHVFHIRKETVKTETNRCSSLNCVLV